MSGVAPVRPRRVAIIGGGFTGAALAWHLARTQAPERPSICVVEPRPFLGGGLAYSSEEPSHRINVPAFRMNMTPEDPDHFLRWLIRDGELEREREAVWKDGNAFPRRRVFGRYVAEHLAPLIEAGVIRHIEDRATRVARVGTHWTVHTARGPIEADIVVLAMTHPPPGIPGALLPISEAYGFVRDPYEPDALSGIAPDEPVLIVGAGLTSADMVAELDRRGHHGRILALSRHGLRSRGHPQVRGEPFGDFASQPAETALRLLQDIREALASARASNVNWQSVLDQVRLQGPAIWSALSLKERARLVQRLRTFWDVHRFRIAPQVEAVLDRRSAIGTFDNIAAGLVGSTPDGSGLAVSFRRRGQARVETIRFGAVINTTGPAHGSALQHNAPLRSLAEAGLIRADRYGLGIDTSLGSRAVDRNGDEVGTLFVAGPLARGTFGELMGLPEVARHALTVAAEITSLLQAAPGGPRGAAEMDGSPSAAGGRPF